MTQKDTLQFVSVIHNIIKYSEVGYKKYNGSKRTVANYCITIPQNKKFPFFGL